MDHGCGERSFTVEKRPKQFYRVEVHNGISTSFWHEKWTSLGCLKDIVREGSCIDIGILIHAKVEDSKNHRKKHHQVEILNRIEMEIEKFKENWVQEEDLSLWKNDKGKYKKTFSTKETWLSIREKHHLCSWYPAVWFKHATLKYCFITWIAMHGRLSTGDRMQRWNMNVDASCVLCQEPLETLSHLFFDCAYSAQVWEALMKGVLEDQYTVNWERLVSLTTRTSSWSKIKMFITRYMFQSTIHMIWRERNRRRHGEVSAPATLLVKRLDKNMRNIFTVIRRRGDKEYEGGMTIWFDIR